MRFGFSIVHCAISSVPSTHVSATNSYERINFRFYAFFFLFFIFFFLRSHKPLLHSPMVRPIHLVWELIRHTIPQSTIYRIIYKFVYALNAKLLSLFRHEKLLKKINFLLYFHVISQTERRQTQTHTKPSNILQWIHILSPVNVNVLCKRSFCFYLLHIVIFCAEYWFSYAVSFDFVSSSVSVLHSLSILRFVLSILLLMVIVQIVNLFFFLLSVNKEYRNIIVMWRFWLCLLCEEQKFTLQRDLWTDFIAFVELAVAHFRYFFFQTFLRFQLDPGSLFSSLDDQGNGTGTGTGTDINKCIFIFGFEIFWFKMSE